MRSIVEKMQQVQSGLTYGTDWRRIGVGLIRPSPHAGQAGGGLAQIAKFASPNKGHRKPRKRLTPKEAGIQARLEHLYPVKALIERLFGRAAFMKIKMGGTMNEWREASIKLLDAIELSVKSSIVASSQVCYAAVTRRRS